MEEQFDCNKFHDDDDADDDMLGSRRWDHRNIYGWDVEK